MVAGLIHDVPTVKELIDRIMAEADAIIRKRLAGFVRNITVYRLANYPVTCLIFSGETQELVEELSAISSVLHKYNIAYNLLFSKDNSLGQTRVYLFPRSKEVSLEFPEMRLASLEMCGEFMTQVTLDAVAIRDDDAVGRE